MNLRVAGEWWASFAHGQADPGSNPGRHYYGEIIVGFRSPKNF